MSDLLKKLFGLKDISSEYVRQVCTLLQQIREVDLSFLSATTYEMMDNETHDLPEGKEKPKRLLQLKLHYIRQLLGYQEARRKQLKDQLSGPEAPRKQLEDQLSSLEAYHKQLEDQRSILESLLDSGKTQINPNVLLSPEPDRVSGYMSVLGPGLGSTSVHKDLVEDDSGRITPVSDKLQIGFDTPVRAFSWYTLYLLKRGKNEHLPPTAPLIRTFRLPRENFIELSKEQIEESGGEEGSEQIKEAFGAPNAEEPQQARAPKSKPVNAEDLKVPNQMGFPSEALEKEAPEDLLTYFSRGDYGKGLIASSKTADIDTFKEKIGFGQYHRQSDTEAARFIPSALHFFDRQHTAFHQENTVSNPQNKNEENTKWQAYSYLGAVHQLIIFTTFFDAIAIYEQTGELLEKPELIIPEEIREKVPEKILKGIKMPEDTSSMLRNMLNANRITWDDYQAMEGKAMDRRGNKKSSFEAEDWFASGFLATLAEKILPFTQLGDLSIRVANRQRYQTLQPLRQECLKSKNLEECRELAQIFAEGVNQPADILAKIKETKNIIEIKQIIGPIALEQEKTDFPLLFEDVALRNTFSLLKESILQFTETTPGKEEAKKKMAAFFKGKSELMDFLADRRTYTYLNLILSSPIRAQAVRNIAVELKFHTLNFFFRLLRIIKDIYPLRKPSFPAGRSLAAGAPYPPFESLFNPQAPPNIRVERAELDSPYERVNPESRDFKAGETWLHTPFDRNRSQVVYTRPEGFDDKTIYNKTETPFMGGVSGTTRDITFKVIDTFPPDQEGEKAYWQFQLANAAFMIANRFHSFLEVIYPAALLGNLRFKLPDGQGISAQILDYIKGLSASETTSHREVIQHILALSGQESDFMAFADASSRPETGSFQTDASSAPTQPGPVLTSATPFASSSGYRPAIFPSAPRGNSLIFATYPIAPSQPGADRQLDVYPTVGDGSCGIHALLGTLQPLDNQYRFTDTNAVRQQLFTYMGENREDLLPRYLVSIADLLSEIQAGLRSGETLTNLQLSHLNHFEAHVGDLRNLLNIQAENGKVHSENLAASKKELIEEIIAFLRSGTPDTLPALAYLVESVSGSNGKTDQIVKAPWGEATSGEEKIESVRQSPYLFTLIDEDLDKVLSRLQNTVLAWRGPYQAVRNNPAPSIRDLVGAHANGLYDGYCDIIKEEGYFLREEDMRTLADEEGVGLVMYILSDREPGKVVEHISHETGRENVRRVFHRGVHYQHAELREAGRLEELQHPLPVDERKAASSFSVSEDMALAKEGSPAGEESPSEKTASSESSLPREEASSIAAIADWEDRVVTDGLIVYHGTDIASAGNIQKNGILPSVGGYGSGGSGGELGHGFYVTSDRAMAEAYAEGKAQATQRSPAILSFRVKKEIKGKVVPGSFLWKIPFPYPDSIGFFCTANDYNFFEAKELLELVAEDLH